MKSDSQNLRSVGDKTMSDKRGGSISEEDVSAIFQRYTATTVLTLLQEVAQIQDVKMDWDALVKKTKTGITNPREYQMLWRHLAYRDPLLEKFEDDAEPLDDGSDLEYELEAFPTVSNEASAEAAACVKVHIASGSHGDSSVEKGLTMEAPLLINIPRANSMSGVHIIIPVFVPTLVVPAVSSGEVLDTNGNLPARRKRKPWSAAEDNQLFAAVQKCGEGNWVNISKGDFKGDRTASQLSQRWSIIKKRQSYSNTKPSSQLSEVQLAARRALNMALDKPGVDNPKAASSLGMVNSGNISGQPTVAEPPQQDLKRSVPRPQVFPARPSPKLLPSGSDAVKAAAVAAGARIATQSAEAAILKSQLKTAIHIKTTPNGTTRPPTPGAHMGPDYFRPQASRGLGHANVNTGPVVKSETSDEHEVKPSVSASLPVEPVQDVVQDDQEEKPPVFCNPANTNLESK